MVTDVYNTALRAEKELEHLANEATGEAPNNPAQQVLNETRHIAEVAIGEALKVADNWGKSALDKAHEITEEICL